AITAGPESMTDALVGVCLSRNDIRAFARRRDASGKAGHSQIEGTPPEVHGTDFADESGAKRLEDIIDPDQCAPESMRILGVIRSMDAILIEADRVRNLDGHSPNFHIQTHIVQMCHQLLVKVRDRLRSEREKPRRIIAASDPQLVLDEIKLDLEQAIAVWH